MKKHRSVFAALLLALVAAAPAQNPIPPGTSALATPAKPDATAEIKVASTPYHAAVEAVSAEYQKWVAALETWYLAELDKLQAARAKLGDLDGAVAIKAERDRFAAHAATIAEEIQAMPAPLRTLRTTSEQGVKRIADEGARRIDVSRRKYLADLEALQKRITIGGDIDQALLVKAEKERFIAEMAADAQGVAAVAPAKVAADPFVATTPKPQALVPKIPFGTKPGPTPAKVEVDETMLASLEVGAAQNSDVKFTDIIPKEYEGYRFTQAPTNHQATLRFKVLSDGLVQMACSSRFGGGGNSGGGWKDEVISEQKLEQKGWHRQRGVELKNNQPDFVWLVFTRMCKTGEQFSIRTEKYYSPFLLVK